MPGRVNVQSFIYDQANCNLDSKGGFLFQRNSVGKVARFVEVCKMGMLRPEPLSEILGETAQSICGTFFRSSKIPILACVFLLA